MRSCRRSAVHPISDTSPWKNQHSRVVMPLGLLAAISVLVALAFMLTIVAAENTGAQATSSTWGDVTCNGVIDGVDLIELARVGAGLAQAGNYPGCPKVGTHVTANGVSRKFGDNNCNGTLGPDDLLSPLRRIAGVTPPSNPIGCPTVGASFDLGSGSPTVAQITSSPAPSLTSTPTASVLNASAFGFAWFAPDSNAGLCDHSKPIPPNTSSTGLCVSFQLTIPSGTYSYTYNIFYNGSLAAGSDAATVSLSSAAWDQPLAYVPLPGGVYRIEIIINGVVIGSSTVTVPGTPSPTVAGGTPTLTKTPSPTPTKAPTPTPTKTPTPTPTKTPSLSPTKTPSPAPTPTSTPAPVPIYFCWMAILANDMVNGFVSGESCYPSIGYSYSCTTIGTLFVDCSTSVFNAGDYSCTVISITASCNADFISGWPDYNCTKIGSFVDCSTFTSGWPDYSCLVSGTLYVSCSTFTLGYYSFGCTRFSTVYSCG